MGKLNKDNISLEECTSLMNRSLRTIQRWCEKNNVYKGSNGYVIDPNTLNKMHIYYYGVGNVISNTPEDLNWKLERDRRVKQNDYEIINSLTLFEFDDVIIKNNELAHFNNIKETAHFQAVRSPRENRVALKVYYPNNYNKCFTWSYNYTSLIERKDLLHFLEKEIAEGVYFEKLNESLLYLMEVKVHTVAKEYRRVFDELNKMKDVIETYRVAWEVEHNTRKEYNEAPRKTYIMKDSATGLYKIGKSKNPEYREKTLQSEKPTIKMIKVFESDIESDLHKEFADVRVRGEWFKLNKVQLKRICTHYE